MFVSVCVCSSGSGSGVHERECVSTMIMHSIIIVLNNNDIVWYLPRTQGDGAVQRRHRLIYHFLHKLTPNTDKITTWY